MSAAFHPGRGVDALWRRRFDLAKRALAELPEEPAPKGHYHFYDLDWVVEVQQGGTRKGRTTTLHYGHIKGTRGKDGEGIDFWMDPAGLGVELFFVVNQNAKGGGLDEHKVMVGFKSEEEARRGYLDNYPHDLGPKLLGSVKPMTLPQFKKWLLEADKEKAAAACPPGECCPSCGARLERDPDSGTCNSCGEDWPEAREPFTVAVDLDGTLAEAEVPFDPKSIGKPRPRAKHWLDALAAAGARVIVFTVRGDAGLVKAWLDKHDMPYDHVNENPDQPPDSSGKVFAHAYWDDRAHNGADLDEHGPRILEMARAHAA